MNKKFSLVLAIVMLFTVFAIPAAVSAAATDVTLTIAADKETYYAGDTVNVVVSANIAEGEYTFTESQVVLTYDSSKLTLVETEDIVKGTLENTVLYNAYLGANLVLTADAAHLFTAQFTVKEAAVAGDITFGYNEALTGFVNAETLVTATTVVTTDTAAIAASSIVANYATASNEEYAEITTDLSIVDYSMTVKIEAVGNVEYADLYVADAEEATASLADGEAYEITTDGSYVIKAKVKGAAEKVYTFKFTKKEAEEIVADLALCAPENNANGFKLGDAVSMPVIISGMAEDMTAAMVKFSVAFDADMLALNGASTETVTYTEVAEGEYTVLFESETASVGNDGVVVELPFVVAATATVGSTSVTITAIDWAQYTETPDWTSYAINTTVPTVGVTVIPSGAFATLPENVMEENYVNADYTVAVTAVDGVEVKYAFGETVSTEDIATLYENASLLTDGAVAINNEAYTYVVIAKVGDDPAVYSIVATLAPGSGNWLDKTAPAVDTADYAIPSDWTSTEKNAATLDISAITTDEDATIWYSLTGENNYEEVGGSSITIPVGTTLETVYLKAIDRANNESSAATIAVKYDGEAPTVSAEAGSLTATGRAIAVDASDNKELASVVVYYSADNGTLDSAEAIEGLDNGANITGAATYDAQNVGFYYVVATDAAGAKAITGAIAIDLDKVNAVGVKAAIVNGAELKAGLVAGDAVNNGYFTYIKIEADDAAAGYATTLTLTKEGEEGEVVEAVELTNEEAGAYTLTVTTAEVGNETNNFGTAVYKFNIAANQAGMMSVDDNAYYNVYDLAVLKNFVSIYEGNIEDYDYFEEGLFSADVTGSLDYTIDDVDDVLDALKAGLFTGLYADIFANMNGVN